MGRIAEDGPFFRAILITRGRKTGREHGVTLRAVRHGGKIYFSRHRPDGDWFLNAVANPDVKVLYGDQTFRGTAKMVTDERLSMRISELKYPGEERAREKRVAIEVTPE